MTQEPDEHFVITGKNGFADLHLTFDDVDENDKPCCLEAVDLEGDLQEVWFDASMIPELRAKLRQLWLNIKNKY